MTIVYWIRCDVENYLHCYMMCKDMKNITETMYKAVQPLKRSDVTHGLIVDSKQTLYCVVKRTKTCMICNIMWNDSIERVWIMIRNPR